MGLWGTGHLAGQVRSHREMIMRITPNWLHTTKRTEMSSNNNITIECQPPTKYVRLNAALLALLLALESVAVSETAPVGQRLTAAPLGPVHPAGVVAVTGPTHHRQTADLCRWEGGEGRYGT